MKRRDSFQRKAYAIHRMSSAAQRLMQATNAADKDKARAWMDRWCAASGLRRFRLGNGGGRVKHLDLVPGHLHAMKIRRV
jgi:hypothetical protein